MLKLKKKKKSLANKALTKNKITPFITKLNNFTISILFLVRIKGDSWYSKLETR